jgi:hypothetical protein
MIHHSFCHLRATRTPLPSERLEKGDGNVSLSHELRVYRVGLWRGLCDSEWAVSTTGFKDSRGRGFEGKNESLSLRGAKGRSNLLTVPGKDEIAALPPGRSQ